jgi:16S rRNA (cytosine1402-N4)-methyltransferase
MTHQPVMLDEMIKTLNPQSGEIYLDGTFGGGGYAKAILDYADCHLIVLDRDPEAIARAQQLAQHYPEQMTVLQGAFSELESLFKHRKLPRLNGVVFDFGVSSYQIDEAERGFSFRFDGPLDMRMSQVGVSAADVVNHYSEIDIADIIYRYGEERQSRRIARAIIQYRKTKLFETTLELANVIKSVIRGKPGAQHPATLTFQALRIFVNNELIEIESGLIFAENYLAPGGRLVAITFHSLEDRLVKTFLKQRAERLRSSRLLPGEQEPAYHPTFYLLHPKGLAPSEREVRQNSRARSARLRAALRLPLIGDLG